MMQFLRVCRKEFLEGVVFNCMVFFILNEYEWKA